MKLKRPVQYLVILLTLAVTFLQIGLAAKPPVTDDYLIDEIRSKLASDQVVKGGAIDVDVHDGVVTLKGKVEEEKQKDKAEKVAKKVNGVKSVKNEIVLSRP
jgi:osmotically-inducible protein OsmY